MQESIERQLEIKRVETLYEQSYPALAANFFTAVLFCLVLGWNGYLAMAVPWMALMLAILAVRYRALRSFQAAEQAAPSPAYWFRRYGIGITVTGGLWGCIGAYSILTPSPTLVFFAVAILVGMVGGSVATCAVSVPIFLAFTLPALLPASAALILGTSSENAIIGVLLLVYIAVVTRSVVQVKGVIVQSLFHRYENKRLLGELEKEKQQIQASEEQLREAYGELEATHGALVEQRSLVDQERVVSARLREVDKLKDEFLANTSHELRTPLYGIVGLVESLIDGAAGELPELATADLARVAASGRRLTALVNDILDFSKLKHHGLELEAKAVDLHAVVDVVLAVLRPLVGGKTLRLDNAVPRDAPLVWADENRLQQILHNLVGNAIKFSESGEVVVAAEQGAGEAGPADRPASLRISVRDTGIGIAPDQQERIFEAFTQADGATERQFGGTGLGLAVTRQLIDLHGGDLRVASTVGEGSTFSFDLPLADCEAQADGVAEESQRALVEAVSQPTVAALRGAADDSSPELPEVASAATDGAAANGATILVVDDEPVNRQVLVNQLAAAGYRIDQASSGAAALRSIEQQAPDLVLLDVMMPRMSGYEACQTLRQRYTLDELPVLFLTAKSQPADLVLGLAAGANDYLPKPIAKSELLARVKTHLDLRAVHRQLSGLVAERTAEVEEREQLLVERQALIGDLESKNAELARFNYTVAHDLKNPLVTIQNFLGLARRDAEAGRAEQLAHDLNRLQTAADKLQRLLDELFELSSIGLHTNTTEAVSVADLVRTAQEALVVPIHESSAVLEVAPELPTLYGDRPRLEELMRHLIDNALRHADGQTP
ncbi:MAG: ATP-binding protein, partial [Acidobacteriota bacterium]